MGERNQSINKLIYNISPHIKMLLSKQLLWFKLSKVIYLRRVNTVTIALVRKKVVATASPGVHDLNNKFDKV